MQSAPDAMERFLTMASAINLKKEKETSNSSQTKNKKFENFGQSKKFDDEI